MNKNTKILLILSIILFIIAIAIFAFCKINSNTTTPKQQSSEQTSEQVEFTFTDDNGNEYKIDEESEFGKAIIFWSSDTENSLETLELIDTYYEIYKDSIDFYIINTNEKHKDIISLVNGCNFSFPVYYDSNNKSSEFYTIEKLPTLIFIDKQDEMHTLNGGIDDDTLTANLDILAENY